MATRDHRLRTARDQFLRSVIAWRRERIQNEVRLRHVEHELSLALAQLIHAESLEDRFAPAEGAQISDDALAWKEI